jgi:hypothetical protein
VAQDRFRAGGAGDRTLVQFRKVVQRVVRDKSGRNVGSVNAAVAANVNEPGTRTSVSSHQRIVQRSGRRNAPGEQSKEGSMAEHEYKPVTREELNRLAGEELPERAAMSLINANLAAPVNAAVALNVASDNSVAYANAEQNATIDQTAGG